MSFNPDNKRSVYPWHDVRSSWSSRSSSLFLVAVTAATAVSLSGCNNNGSDVSAAVAADVDAFLVDYNRVKDLPDFKQGLADVRKMDVLQLAQNLPQDVTLGKSTFTNVATILTKAAAALNVPKATHSDSLEAVLLKQNALSDHITRTDVESLFAMVAGILNSAGSEGATRQVLSKFSAAQVAHAYNAAVFCDVTRSLQGQSSRLLLKAAVGDPLTLISPITGAVKDLWTKNNEMEATRAAAGSIKACTAQTNQSTEQQKKESACNTATPDKALCLNKDSYPAFINGPATVAQGASNFDCSYKQWSCSCSKNDDANTCLLTLAGGSNAVTTTPCVPATVTVGKGT